jgi:hypothetical protein
MFAEILCDSVHIRHARNMPSIVTEDDLERSLRRDYLQADHMRVRKHVL